MLPLSIIRQRAQLIHHQYQLRLKCRPHHHHQCRQSDRQKSTKINHHRIRNCQSPIMFCTTDQQLLLSSSTLSSCFSRSKSKFQSKSILKSKLISIFSLDVYSMSSSNFVFFSFIRFPKVTLLILLIMIMMMMMMWDVSFQCHARANTCCLIYFCCWI